MAGERVQYSMSGSHAVTRLFGIRWMEATIGGCCSMQDFQSVILEVDPDWLKVCCWTCVGMQVDVLYKPK